MLIAVTWICMILDGFPDFESINYKKFLMEIGKYFFETHPSFYTDSVGVNSMVHSERLPRLPRKREILTAINIRSGWSSYFPTTGLKNALDESSFLFVTCSEKCHISKACFQKYMLGLNN